MKRFMNSLLFAIVMISLLWISVSQAFNDCQAGSYYSPDRVGEGINIEIIDANTMVAYFYTFGSEGRAWYTMIGEGAMPLYGTLKNSEEPFETETWEVGSATVTFLDEHSLLFSYDLVIDIDQPFGGGTPWCLSGYCSGKYEYVRLTVPIGCK